MRQRYKLPPGFGTGNPATPFVTRPGEVVRFSDLVRRFGARGPRTFGGFAGPAARGGGQSTAIPTPTGAPGNFVDPYNETDGAWGGPQGAGVTAPLDPSSPLPPLSSPALAPGADGLSIPFGQSFTPWRNPTTLQSVPINAATPTATPVLSTNLQRNMLIVQNGSTATSPDVPPILYIGFNAAPLVGFTLGVAYNLGAILFDIITPRDSIYVLFGPFTNGGGTVVIRGTALQGTYVPQN